MADTENFGIGAVLEAYFELCSYAGAPAASWSEQNFRGNPPRLYRYQRLQALLRAFNLPADAAQLPTGRILSDRPPATFQFLHDELEAAYRRGEVHSAPRPARPSGYGMLYQQFFRLLHEHYRLHHFNSGWLEAGSAEAQYAIRIAQQFIDSYDQAQLAAVRQTVCRLLDPAGQQFSRQELVKRFGFPNVDLHEVDIEWM